MNAYLREDLIDTNDYDEDGTRLVGKLYFIVVEGDDGYRMQHVNAFDVIDDSLENLVNAINNKITIYGLKSLNRDYWFEIDPRYGSEAHQHIGDYHLMSRQELERQR
tara:strand:- start:977 stop:1297 length:321 start_codon:yes stop_codon:yes gene_type:complete